MKREKNKGMKEGRYKGKVIAVLYWRIPINTYKRNKQNRKSPLEHHSENAENF